MNKQERGEIGMMWLVAAKTFRGIELDLESVEMLLNSVQDLPFAKVKQFMIDWMQTSKTGRHPYPAEVREACGFKAVDNKSLALEATARINQAIIKFGEYDAQDALKFIGDLGWRGVQRMGGWAHLCASHGLTLNPTTFTAQMRDLLISQLELKEAGFDDQPIMLDRRDQRRSSGELTKGFDMKLIHNIAFEEETNEKI